MGYSIENIKRVKESYASKQLASQNEANNRRAELYVKLPELKGLDRAIADLGHAAVRETIGGGEGAAARIMRMKEQSLELQEERKKLLIANGYPADYTQIHYECDKCNDTGYIDTKMCDCMKRALILAGYETSGIKNLMQTQTFDSFSLDYYKQNNKIYESMKLNFETMKNFAENFSDSFGENIALFGGTGLGKTHLSTSVAKTVIDRGFDVLYVTAVGMIADFERERFGSGYSDTDVGGLSRYYNCDLLIVDDIGTEVSNQFTVSVLYNVLNTRLNKKKSTIISTNLTPAELRTRYWDRIASRIFGEYTALLFEGTDIRMQKLKTQKR